MRTYRELFGVGEFRPLLAAMSLDAAATTVRGLALAEVVFARTGSPILSALSLFGASLVRVLGALTLLSLADRVPPRAALSASGFAFAVTGLALALPGMPVWAMLTIVLSTGLVSSATGGVQWGLLNEILPAEGYILGRSVFNMLLGVMQIGGYALGGTLVAIASPRPVLAVAAVLNALMAVVAWSGLSRRPPRASGRPSVAETWRTNRRLWSDPLRRNLYYALWVPNGLIVGCEALFIPYDPGSASVLFGTASCGMLVGDTIMGRFISPERRTRLFAPTRILLAAPYLLFVIAPPIWLAAPVVALASTGYSCGLLLQERLLAVTPSDMQGQALGLHSSGLLTMQAVGASMAGAVAEGLPVGGTMALLAAASLAVTLALTPRLRPQQPPTQIESLGRRPERRGQGQEREARR